MNQDQIIRFLMDNIDAVALAEANRNGSTIMYFAGVAQRWPNNNVAGAVAAPRNRVGRVHPVAEEAEPDPARPARRQPAVREEAAVNLNENENNVPAPRRPAARPVGQVNGNADRVRVGGY